MDLTFVITNWIYDAFLSFLYVCRMWYCGLGNYAKRSLVCKFSVMIHAYNNSFFNFGFSSYFMIVKELVVTDSCPAHYR